MASRPRILLRGSPRWVRLLSRTLPAVNGRPTHADKPMQNPGRFDWRRRLRWRRTDILHQVMLDCRSKNTQQFFETAQRYGVPIVAHWIGSDVLRLCEHVEEHGQPPSELFDLIELHLADSPQLAAELAGLGVRTQVVRLLPPSVSAPIMPLSAAPAALVYLPTGAEDFYRFDLMKQLAAAFSDVTFYVAANDGTGLGATPSNIQFLGEVTDMDALYKKVNVLIRICEHDSLSAMVLEALARGRYVIYSESFPHTVQARTFDEAQAALADMVQKKEPNRLGSAHVAENFSWQAEMKQLREHYDRLLVR